MSAIEEKHDINTLIIVQLHGILTTFEMRKRGLSKVKEDAFRATTKGKDKEE